MGEKTEKATPKKLRDARKKGQVAKSQDFPAAFTFMVSICTTLYLSSFLFDHLGTMLTSSMQLVNQPNLVPIIQTMFMRSFYEIFICSLPMLLLTSIIGIIITFLTVGPTFSIEVFKFDIKKFNPVDNLKSKFKMKTLFELIKSLFKIGVAAFIVYDVMLQSLPVLSRTAGLPLQETAHIFAYFLYEVVAKVGLFFLIIAIFDLVYQKHTFNKEMMMEKFEVKQEYKDTEGDPLIKGKRKQIAHEIAFSESPAAGAAKAKAVVTNPTHLAIALAFDKEVDMAPYIIAMGREYMAEQIIKIAERNNVPIVQNIPLAHKLWDEGKLYEYINEDVYEPVAEILRWIATLQQEDALNQGDGMAPRL